MRYSYELFIKELGVRLKQMRNERGWTLRDMIVDHSFHMTHWQGFEKGKGISVQSLLRVCEVFDIKLDDLVEGLGFTTPSSKAHTGDEPVAKTPAKVARSSRKSRS